MHFVHFNGSQLKAGFAVLQEATNVQQNVTLFRNFVARCRHIRCDSTPAAVASNSLSSSNQLFSTQTAKDNDGRTKAQEDNGMADHVIEVLTDLVRNTVVSVVKTSLVYTSG
jgi:hypothetical protein